MWQTLISLCLALSGQAPPRPAPRRRPAFRSPSHRPRLEALEDRAVPASLSYSTFLHGTVFATAVDSSGDVYVTGSTDSSLPTTPGAFQTTGSGAFVAKLNATGTALLYATYLGNSTSGAPAGTGIAVDAAGDAYVIGTTYGVPTTANAIASSGGSNNPPQADFIAELNPTGSGPLYATYLPGTVNYPGGGSGYPAAIAVDGSGNIYVAGAADAGLPVTAGAFQTAYLGNGGHSGNNAFFAKIDPALSGTASVVYATYLGGNGGDAATAIALDGAGNAYLEGYTFSTNFPATSGAFQTMLGGGTGTEDAFVAKINPSLSGAASLVYSTYLGGGAYSGSGYVSSVYGDTAQIDGGIAVDSAGNAYVTSATTSLNFPTTPGSYQVNSNMPNLNNGGPTSSTQPSDVFVTKLNATGSALVYSTYIGGGTIVSGKSHGKPVISGTRSGGAGIAVDASGDAELTGWTNSTTFTTVNALQTTNAGEYDAFVTVLNPSGSGLLFSSYFGGSGNDYGFSIALDSAGNAYVGGGAGSSNFPTTAGAYQTTPGSGFVLKIDPPADVSEVSVPIPTDGRNLAAALAGITDKDVSVLFRAMTSAAPMGSFTTSAYPLTAGSSLTLTAANLTDDNPSSPITQAAFYYLDSSGNQQLLGYGTQTSSGTWSLTLTVSLKSGSYTLFAQATDSDGILGDPLSLTLTVQ